MSQLNQIFQRIKTKMHRFNDEIIKEFVKPTSFQAALEILQQVFPIELSHES